MSDTDLTDFTDEEPVRWDREYKNLKAEREAKARAWGTDDE